jgi:hypothetical protein
LKIFQPPPSKPESFVAAAADRQKKIEILEPPPPIKASAYTFTHTLNYDCWEVVDRLKHQEIAQKMYVYVHMKPIPRNFGLIPVRSAFGGFGVYQTIYLNGCYYEAFDQITKQKCEHVSFHDCIISNGGRIFINPKFQNADGRKN